MAHWQLGLDRQQFLAEYWQRKPLLLKNALPDFEPPVDANGLAGLALEEEVESRIIACRDGQWELSLGPFVEADFRRPQPWTLLVQAVDHYLPEVAELRKLVDFIPSWRLDDIMISYAVDGGSVGPHFDNYDVFLLQGSGKRRWQVGQTCDGATELVPHDELRILADFRCEAEYIMTTGDILYLPPGVAHWGIAQGECTTYSIGFRAPRITELLSRSVDALLETSDPDHFYRDPGATDNGRPGEIRPEDLEAAREQLLATIRSQSDGSWFGELLTEPKYSEDFEREESYPTGGLLSATPTAVELPAEVRLAWQQTEAGVTVFADGESANFSPVVIPLLSELCGEWRVAGKALQTTLSCAENVTLLEWLMKRSCLELG